MSQPAGIGMRKVALWGGLALSVAVSVYTYYQDGRVEEGEPIIEPVEHTRVVAQSTAEVPLSDIGVRQQADESPDGPQVAKTKVLLDPFAPLAVVLLPPPAPVAPVVVATPTAPPLPFQYAGKFEQPLAKNAAKGSATQTVVYLTRGNDSFAVAPGDAIDAGYQFVGIEDDTLVFMYLPLATRQTLPIGP